MRLIDEIEFPGMYNIVARPLYDTMIWPKYSIGYYDVPIILSLNGLFKIHNEAMCNWRIK
jgi:hypothetical protein